VNGRFTANTVTQFTSLHAGLPVAYITDLPLAKNSSAVDRRSISSKKLVLNGRSPIYR